MPAKNSKKRGQQEHFVGEQAEFLRDADRVKMYMLALESENAHADVGLFYTKCAKDFIARWGDGKQTFDPNDGQLAERQLAAAESEHLNAMRIKLGQWYRRNYKRPSVKSGPDNPIMDVFRESVSKKPKKKAMVQYYMKTYTTEAMTAEYNQRYQLATTEWAAKSTDEKKGKTAPSSIAIRTAVATEYLARESDEVKKKLKDEIENLHKTEMDEFAAQEKEPLTPEDFDLQMHFAGQYIFPVAKEIARKAQAACSVFLMLPVGGIVEIQSCHVAWPGGPQSATWPKLDPTGYELAEKSACLVAKKIFPPEEIIRRTLMNKNPEKKEDEEEDSHEPDGDDPRLRTVSADAVLGTTSSEEPAPEGPAPEEEDELNWLDPRLRGVPANAVSGTTSVEEPAPSPPEPAPVGPALPTPAQSTGTPALTQPTPGQHALMPSLPISPRPAPVQPEVPAPIERAPVQSISPTILSEKPRPRPTPYYGPPGTPPWEKSTRAGQRNGAQGVAFDDKAKGREKEKENDEIAQQTPPRSIPPPEETHVVQKTPTHRRPPAPLDETPRTPRTEHTNSPILALRSLSLNTGMAPQPHLPIIETNSAVLPASSAPSPAQAPSPSQAPSPAQVPAPAPVPAPLLPAPQSQAVSASSMAERSEQLVPSSVHPSSGRRLRSQKISQEGWSEDMIWAYSYLKEVQVEKKLVDRALGEEWQAIVDQWALWQGGQLVGPNLLPMTDTRPTEISAWIKLNRTRRDIEITDFDEFRSRWWPWWAAQGGAGPLSRKKGKNGLFLVMLTLAWWGSASRREDDWKRAVREVTEMIGAMCTAATVTSANSRKRGRENDDGPRSKRARRTSA